MPALVCTPSSERSGRACEGVVMPLAHAVDIAYRPTVRKSLGRYGSRNVGERADHCAPMAPAA